jgi:hypothetical protein
MNPATTLASLVRRPGITSSAVLAGSGIAIVAMPQRVGKAIGAPPVSGRGITEVRVGLGGTYAALGLWALARGTSDAYTAVGMTWLGAAAVRLLGMRLDTPEKDATFWTYLGLESVMGVAGVIAGGRRSAA